MNRIISNMKKYLILLCLTLFVTVGIFAREEFTFTVDVAPTLLASMFSNAETEEDLLEFNTTSKCFGIGVQIEQMVTDISSVALRFAYFGIGFMESWQEAGERAELDFNFYALTFEGQGRYYLGDTFFVGGIFGFTRLTSAFSGTAFTKIDGVRVRETVSISASRNYFKLGAKLGWKFDFDYFVFEPSFGYDFNARAFGNTFGQQLGGNIGDDLTELDEAFDILANYIFVGGPRISLAFGIKF